MQRHQFPNAIISTPMQRCLIISSLPCNQQKKQANDTNPNNSKRHDTIIRLNCYPPAHAAAKLPRFCSCSTTTVIDFPLKQRMDVCLLQSLKPAHTSAGATHNTITAQLLSGLNNQFHQKERDSNFALGKDKQWPVTHLRTFPAHARGG